MRTMFICVFATVALSISTGAIGRQDGLSRPQALMITRMVLAIETTGRGTYLDLRSVVKLAQDPQSGLAIPELSTANPVDSTTVAVQDFTLQLTRADDGKHFQMSLTPTVPTRDDTRPSWFSDDRGVIYTGKPID